MLIQDRSTCPYCGQTAISYLGVDDAGYDDMGRPEFADYFKCEACDAVIQDGEFDYIEAEDDGE